MAHAGQVWKLAFRRDFNLNVDTNQGGWANRYIVGLPQLGTGPAGFWSFSHWDCGPGVDLAPASILWRSDKALKFGVHWWIEIELRLNPDSTYTKLGRFQTLEFGLIAQWIHGPDHTRLPQWPPSLEGQLLFWDTGFFDEQPQALANLTTYRPKVWSEGEPH